MSIRMDKIEEFLKKVEGKQQLQGYIPSFIIGTDRTMNYKGVGEPSQYDPMGISGVTIATGVDLGQTDYSTLHRLGLSSSFLSKLTPYLEKSDKDAVYALHNNPLYINATEADALDNVMHWYHAELISARYNKDAGEGVYETLPWQAQTAIYSILYQRGTGSPSKYRNTWNAFVKQDWEDASARLHNGSFWDGNYDSRRALEGDLLDDLIAEQKENNNDVTVPEDIPNVEVTPEENVTDNTENTTSSKKKAYGSNIIMVAQSLMSTAPNDVLNDEEKCELKILLANLTRFGQDLT